VRAKTGFDGFNFGCQYTAQKSVQKREAVNMWKKYLKQLKY